jgi:hypothetical protein
MPPAACTSLPLLRVDAASKIIQNVLDSLLCCFERQVTYGAISGLFVLPPTSRYAKRLWFVLPLR